MLRPAPDRLHLKIRVNSPRQSARRGRVRFPGWLVEVINTAMTAINSHVIREIAKDCVRLGADFWVVYAGNNEVVGPLAREPCWERRRRRFEPSARISR
jgi:hypothetical protein